MDSLQSNNDRIYHSVNWAVLTGRSAHSLAAVTNIQCSFDSRWGLSVGPRHCCCSVCRASTVWLLWKSSRATASRCPSEKRWCTLKSKSPLVCTAQPGARGNVWAGATQRESHPRCPHLQTLDRRHEHLEDRTSWGWAAPVLCCPFPQEAYQTEAVGTETHK